MPWKPCCLDAAHGWICVGGDENGQCAFISIDDKSTNGRSHQAQGEVDDLLPLDLDPEYPYARHDLRRSPQWPQYPSGSKYELQCHELGGERVNSVKIHLLSNTKSGVKIEILVVMT